MTSILPCTGKYNHPTCAAELSNLQTLSPHPIHRNIRYSFKTKQKQLKGQRRIRKDMSSSQVAPHTPHLRQLLLSEGKWSGRSREPPKADVPNLSHPGPCPGSGSKPNFPRHWQRQSKQWKLGHFAGPLAGGCCSRQQPTSPILPAGPILQSVLCYVFKLLY